MAYLIHANHWPLARAYAFVMERRKGVSPNIGFVSELMTFEEQKLGGKSVGVVPEVPVGCGASGSNPVGGPVSGNMRRNAHARESLRLTTATIQAQGNERTPRAFNVQAHLNP